MHESETYAPSSASPGSPGGAAPREAVIGQASTVSNASPSDSPHPVIFFDGVCGLCNRFVDFVLRRDPSGYFQFSPLQGEAAAQRLAAAEIADLKTVVVVDGNRGYRKSAAVIHVLGGLGGFWRVVGVLLWIVPRPLRDLGYTLVANNRYALFGKKETCRLPTAAERSRFLP
jgi:predicted DCC family thiol-disulfide oxidoreductase YuxK